MKLIVRSSSLLLTFVGIIGNAKLARAGGVLRRGAVGRLRVGMKIGDLMAEAPREWTARIGEQVIRFYSRNDPDEPALIGVVVNGSISQFQVLSAKYNTDIGVGVGSSLADLGRFYEISWQEPGYAYVDVLKMRFEIRNNKIVAVLVS